MWGLGLPLWNDVGCHTYCLMIWRRLPPLLVLMSWCRQPLILPLIIWRRLPLLLILMSWCRRPLNERSLPSITGPSAIFESAFSGYGCVRDFIDDQIMAPLSWFVMLLIWFCYLELAFLSCRFTHCDSGLFVISSLSVRLFYLRASPLVNVLPIWIHHRFTWNCQISKGGTWSFAGVVLCEHLFIPPWHIWWITK